MLLALVQAFVDMTPPPYPKTHKSPHCHNPSTSA